MKKIIKILLIVGGLAIGSYIGTTINQHIEQRHSAERSVEQQVENLYERKENIEKDLSKLNELNYKIDDLLDTEEVKELKEEAKEEIERTELNFFNIYSYFGDASDRVTRNNYETVEEKIADREVRFHLQKARNAVKKLEDKVYRVENLLSSLETYNYLKRTIEHIGTEYINADKILPKNLEEMYANADKAIEKRDYFDLWTVNDELGKIVKKAKTYQAD